MGKYIENSSDVNVEGIDFYVSEFNPFSEGYAVYTEDPEKYIGLKELSHAFYMNDIVLVLGSGYKCRPDAIKEGLKGTDPETGNEVDYCMIYFYDESGNRSTITSYDKYVSPEPPGPEPGQSILPIPEQYRKNGYLEYVKYNGNKVHVGEKLNASDLTVMWSYTDDNDIQQHIELTKEYYGVLPYDLSISPVSIDDYVIDDYYLNQIKVAVNSIGPGYDYNNYGDILYLYLSDDDPNKDRITTIYITRNPDKLIYMDEDEINFEGLEFNYLTAGGDSQLRYINDNSIFENNINGYIIKPLSFASVSLNSNRDYYVPVALTKLNSNYKLPSIDSIKEDIDISYIDDVKFMNIRIGLSVESYPDNKQNFISGINSATQFINIFVDNDNIIGENDLVISNITMSSLNNSIKRVFETSENITADEIISQTVINSQVNQPGVSARLYLANGRFIDKSMTELKEIINQGGTGSYFDDGINMPSAIGEGEAYINTRYVNSKLYNYNGQEIEVFDSEFGVSNKPANSLSIPIWIVEKRIPTSMFIGLGPTKTSYEVGESFDPTGMSVNITGFSGIEFTYNDSETIPNESIEYVHDAQNPYTSDDISSEYAETISYTENETTISTSQIVSVLQNA